MQSLKSAALFAVLASTSMFGVVGCSMDHNDMDHPHHMNPDAMSNDDMMKKSNDMIAEGTQMKNESMNMADGEMKMGMSKSEMMTKGQKMIDDGQAMKTKAMNNKSM